MTDRLEEIAEEITDRWYDIPREDRQGASLSQHIADALRAAGVTVPEPPKGPVYVTSEATARKWFAFSGASPRIGSIDYAREKFDKLIPDIARDHALLPVAEVERRAREWCFDHRIEFARTDELIAALTRREG